MTNTFWQSIAATPWWIYLFCAYLLWAGFMATKPRLVSVKNLSVMPLFFTTLSVMSMCAMLYNINFIHFAIWIGTLFLGTGLGYLHLYVFNIKAVHQTNSIYLPGSWALLISLVTSLIATFYFDMQFNIDPQILIDPKHSMLLVFMYGLVTGLFLGRLAYALRCLRSGPYTDAVVKAASH